MTRTFPRASKAPSKKSITPRSIKRAPNVVSATPISEEDVEASAVQQRDRAYGEKADFEHLKATYWQKDEEKVIIKKIERKWLLNNLCSEEILRKFKRDEVASQVRTYTQRFTCFPASRWLRASFAFLTYAALKRVHHQLRYSSKSTCFQNTF